MKNSKAQIWVETAVYTAIGLAIIGIVLAVALPAVGRWKDKTLIEQTASALNTLNDKILEVRESSGNVRTVEFRIKKGVLTIRPSENEIVYVLEGSDLEYSQPDLEVELGDIRIKTATNGKKYDISLKLSYQDKNIDLTYDSNNEEKILQKTPIPYKLSISNEEIIDTNSRIDIKEVSG